MNKFTFITGLPGRFAITLMIIVSSVFVMCEGVMADEIDYSEQFFRGDVVKVLGSGQRDVFGVEQYYQILNIRITEGEVLKVDYINPIIKNETQKLKEGDRVVLVKSDLDGEVEYEVYEPYRLPSLFWLTVLFIGLAVLVSGRKGASSLVGLAATLFILIKWIIPGIVAGGNPLIVSFAGAIAIAAISIYLSHGFSKRTSIAVVSTLITLFISLVFAIFSVSFSKLFGMGSEDAIYLASFGDLDLRGLLLGAIVIGTLGVLDDITITQTATVNELHKANSRLTSRQLYRRGLSVGREHIASMINTLVIAYVGVSFPIFLLITKSPQPLWVILNNEFLAEEIVRTLVGSATLVLAVPISTALAAYMYSKKKA